MRAKDLAALFYTDRLNPRGAHKVDHNLTLAERAGARIANPRFPLAIRPEDDERMSRELAAHDLREYFVLNPGGGWRSKCWPAERYGELHRQLVEQYGWRGVVSFGPGEEDLAQEVIQRREILRRLRFRSARPADGGAAPRKIRGFRRHRAAASCLRAWRAGDRTFWPHRSRAQRPVFGR